MVSGRLADRQAVVGRREEGGSGERVRGEGECGRGGGAWSNVGWVSRAGGVFAAVMDDGWLEGRSVGRKLGVASFLVLLEVTAVLLLGGTGNTE